ncbi:MAG TPA: chemotaxis protein CheA [Leptospiraceae bacterium]|nr:chemotaxis protein CheA [Leptospiraceae bacterium]
MDIDLTEVREIFFSEAADLLGKMENALLEIQSGSDTVSQEKINELFRSVHTIKGSAGIFEFKYIVEFTHIVENVLDRLRSLQIPMTPELISVLIKCRDHLSDLVELEVQNRQPDSEMHEVQNSLMTRLSEFSDKKLEIKTSDSAVLLNQKEISVPSETVSENRETAGSEFSQKDGLWHISLRYEKDTFRNGLDPASVFRYLKKNGEIVNLYTITAAIPEISSFDPSECHFGFELLYRTDRDMEFIQDAFEFVQYDCSIKIFPPDRNPEDFTAYVLSRKGKESVLRLVRIFLLMGILDRRQALLLKDYRKKERRLSREKKETSVASEDHLKESSSSANEETKKNPPARENRIVRIDSAKLDQLVDFVGEIVIAGASLSQMALQKKDSQLSEAVSNLNRLVSEIRDVSLNLRMVQIGDTLSKYNRVVRTLSEELGKEIQLFISGGETELDKAVVEKINDPLMHIIRNAIDHGIETAEERKALGKPVKGRLSLHAYHETGSIVIEVSDDGKGLDREKILKKAAEKGLISAEKSMSDEEIFRLIFQPGFSTAEKITNISGRGVGMDVVSRNIEALRGSVTVFSEFGKGTMLQIRLPLTLAIIDGFLFRVGDANFVIPLDNIVECIEFSKKGEDSDGKNFINLRGEILPYLILADVLGIPESRTSRKNVLVLQYAGKKAGVVVDTLHGELQTVIKPLGKIFQNLKGISGSTILGTGEVALLLDIGAFFKRVADLENRHWKKKTEITAGLN